MKQLKVFLLGFVFLAAFNHASAQVDLKINPLGLLRSNLNVAVEFGLADNVGIEATAGIGWNKLNLVVGETEGEFRSLGYRAGVNGRYYFNPSKGLDRFYVGAYGRYAGATWTADDETTTEKLTSTRLAAGFLLGYKVVARNERLLFDFGIGGGRALVFKFDSENGETVDFSDVPFLNWDIPIYISIGYRL